MLARETLNVKRNLDLPQDESASGLKNSPGTKLHTRSFLMGISEREATTTRTRVRRTVSRLAQMPISQNRDMGHTIFVASIDVGHRMRECMNVHPSVGAVLQASASKKCEGEEHGS